MAESLSVEDILEKCDLLLAEMERRQAILRDYVRGLAHGYTTGLYLYGRPGTSKTHTVKAVLEAEIKEPYTYQRGHLTPLGLFELIAEHPDELIVLDDLGAIFQCDIALQILLSALERPESQDRGRVVSYRRQGREERVEFRGGIICISNKELHGDELLEAFKSRVHILNFGPTDAQLGARMLDLAGRGWPDGPSTQEIDPDSARMVALHLIGEMLRLSCPFGLRLLVNKAFPNYQQWKDNETESDWRDLITASIEQDLVAVRHPPGCPGPGRPRRKRSTRSCGTSRRITRQGGRVSSPGKSGPESPSGPIIGGMRRLRGYPRRVSWP